MLNKDKETKKKKHHFVPKVLLRNFATKTPKHIHMYEVKDHVIKQDIPLDPQCQIDYFYGKDPTLEDFFGKIENDIGRVFKRTIREGRIHFKELSIELQTISNMGEFKGFLSEKIHELDIDINNFSNYFESCDKKILGGLLRNPDSFKKIIEISLRLKELKKQKQVFSAMLTNLDDTGKTFRDADINIDLIPPKLFLNPNVTQLYRFLSYQAIRTKKIYDQSNKILNLYLQKTLKPKLILDELLFNHLNEIKPMDKKEYSELLDALKIEMSMSTIISHLTKPIFRSIVHSDIVLLKNTTENAFILSDHPVLRIYKKDKRNLHGQSFLLPISPNLMIYIYDKNLFLTDYNHTVKDINKIEHVELLNSMQYISANKTIYFSNIDSNEHILSIAEKHQKTKEKLYHLRHYPERKTYQLDEDFVFYIENNSVQFNGERIGHFFLK